MVRGSSQMTVHHQDASDLKEELHELGVAAVAAAAAHEKPRRRSRSTSDSEHAPPVMRLQDLLGKESLVGLPPRVKKSISELRPMPLPYDLRPPEMRAKSAKERHERRRRQKKIKEKSGNRSAANAHDGTQSLLHWAWEPSLSDTQISLATEASASRPKRRRPKKPAPAKPALQLETEEDRTELLRRLQERQVAEADYLQVAIDAKRSARECETNSNSFTPTTRPLPSFYHDRLIMDGKRKPGQSRVDCRRRRRRHAAQAVGQQWRIPRSAWVEPVDEGKTTAEAAADRAGRWMAAAGTVEPAQAPELEPEPELQHAARSLLGARNAIVAMPFLLKVDRLPGQARDTHNTQSSTKLPGVSAEAGPAAPKPSSPVTAVIPQVQVEPAAAAAAAAATIAGAISPPKVIAHKVGPPGLEIPEGWEVGEVGAGSYYYFHIDDPGKIYWDGPPWVAETSRENEGEGGAGEEETEEGSATANASTHTDDNADSAEQERAAAVEQALEDAVGGRPYSAAVHDDGEADDDDDVIIGDEGEEAAEPPTDSGSDADAAALAAIDAELAELDQSLGLAAAAAGRHSRPSATATAAVCSGSNQLVAAAAATPSSSSGTSGGQSYSMAGALDDESQFESESVSSVSSLEEDLDGGGGGASDDAEYTFDED